MDEEKAKRVREVLRRIERETKEALASIATGGLLERNASTIAELGAVLHDVAEGREAFPKGHSAGAARGTTTRKVRKALGYTYP